VKRDLISEVNALAEQMSCTSAYVEKSVVLSYGGLNCEVAVLSRTGPPGAGRLTKWDDQRGVGHTGHIPLTDSKCADVVQVTHVPVADAVPTSCRSIARLSRPTAGQTQPHGAARGAVNL